MYCKLVGMLKGKINRRIRFPLRKGKVNQRVRKSFLPDNEDVKSFAFSF